MKTFNFDKVKAVCELHGDSVSEIVRAETLLEELREKGVSHSQQHFREVLQSEVSEK